MHRTTGQNLRSAREAKGLTLLDVAHVTRIPTGRLQQLEDDNFAAFGNMAYAKSFLRNYSQYLSVDATEVAEGLPVPLLGGPADYRYLTETHGPWIERHDKGFRHEPLAKSRSSPVPTLVWMFAVFLVAGALLGKSLVDRHKSDAKTPEAPPSSGDRAAVNVAGTPSAKERREPEPDVAVPPTQALELILPAVLPSGPPPAVSASPPVRRPEVLVD